MNKLVHIGAAVALACGAFAAQSSAAPIYFSDLEANDGGCTGTNDWEYGTPIGFLGGFSSTEPLGGFSGSNVWGAILGADHSISTTSNLTQTFDLSGFSGEYL